MDRSGDGDDDGEDIHVRPRGLRNIQQVQYSAAAHPKSITTFDETTLFMALKSPERMHWVNAICEELDTLANLGTWEDAPELPRDASFTTSAFRFRLKRNEVVLPK